MIEVEGFRITVEPYRPKPCPFCGGEAEAHEARSHSGNPLRFCVRCKDKDCAGRNMKRYTTMQAAVTAWDKRPE